MSQEQQFSETAMSMQKNYIAQVVNDTNRQIDDICMDAVADHIVKNGKEYEVMNISKSKVKEIFKLGFEEYKKHNMI